VDGALPVDVATLRRQRHALPIQAPAPAAAHRTTSQRRVTSSHRSSFRHAQANYDQSVRYVWLVVIVLSGVPLLYVAWLANPLFVILLGVDAWRDRVGQLYPRRWWILFLIAVCAFSVAIYTTRYG
jgi:hypothetical protein